MIFDILAVVFEQLGVGVEALDVLVEVVFDVGHLLDHEVEQLPLVYVNFVL